MCTTQRDSLGANFKGTKEMQGVAQWVFRHFREVQAGIKQKAFYMVMGRYDMVTIAEAPDDATLARALLNLASQGDLQTETLRAFTEDEYKKIIPAIG